MRKFFLYIFCFCILISVGFSAQAYSSLGKPAGFVNDYAGVLSSGEKADLENKLTQFNKETTNEIAVVTIKSLDGDYIENYAVKLFADWKIGKEKQDNGVLLLVAIDDRKMRIEVGYGLEGALPDATAYQIVNNTLKPAFQKSDYYGGIKDGVDKIMAATRGEYIADPEPVAKKGWNMNLEAWFFLIIGAFNLIILLWRHLAKSKHWWEGGVLGLIIGLIIALIFLKSLIYFIILPLSIGAFGLLADYLVSRVIPQPKNTKGGNDIWFFGSGGFGGGNSGGGGFGGFGGGGSGGGGSSGSW